MDIWKIIILWNQSCLGNIKASGNGSIVATIDIHSISDIDCSGHCCTDFIKGIISKKQEIGIVNPLG